MQNRKLRLREVRLLVQGHTETDSCPSPPSPQLLKTQSRKPVWHKRHLLPPVLRKPFSSDLSPSACVYLRLARIPELPCDLLYLRLWETRATRVNESHIPTPANSQSPRVRAWPLPSIAGCGPGGAAHVGFCGFGSRRWCARGGLFQARHQSGGPPGTRGAGLTCGAKA